MQLSLQNFTSLVDNMAAAVQGASSALIDLTVGSVLRATLEASASVALWLQYLLLQVLTMTRLSTSTAGDADTWVQDFGLTRRAATYSSGQVTLSTFNPNAQSATVLTGSTVRTSDGSQTFSVVGGPYTRPIGTASVSVTVVATVAGPEGNVGSGVINILGTAIPGIDTVTNSTAFSGGDVPESDAALRARFITYINTRSQATEQALAYAIGSVQQNLDFCIEENLLPDGTSAPGHIHVILDDGSGHPGQSLLDLVTTAVNAVRPVGTSISVSAPAVIIANVSVLLTVDTAVATSLVEGVVAAALSSYINALGVGQPLRYSRLAGVCYDAQQGIANVQNLLINGLTTDLSGQIGGVVRAGAISITVTAQ